ncbi:MAG: TIGR03986 family CRISPR-associated RAMP protein [Candidatus Saccharicenans sp.]
MKKNELTWRGNTGTKIRMEISKQKYVPDSKAPYNFVPLDERVIAAQEIPFLNCYHKNRMTGYIELEITALTPVYIRDTLFGEEIKKKADSDKSNNPFFGSNFYSPGGLFRIPGSSLRGMIRTIVEILSFSKLIFFDRDKKFSYRALADKSVDFRKQYSTKMIAGNKENGYRPRAKAGYLKKEGMNYFIVPAIELEGVQYFRVEEDDVIKAGVISERMSNFDHYTCEKHKEIKEQQQGSCPKCGLHLKEVYVGNPAYKSGFKPVKFKYDSPGRYDHSVPLYYSKVVKIWNLDDATAPADSVDGVLVMTGWMQGRLGKKGKHMHWVIGPASNEKLKIPDEVIKNYEGDIGRDGEKNIDIIKELEKNPETKIPCFYLEENGKIKSIGNTAFFRISYEKSLKEFVPEKHKEFDIIDMAEAIFGSDIITEKRNSIAGRVFFEDAFLISDLQSVLMAEETPKILSSPKPTTFQHYLKQNHDNLYTYDGKIEGLKTYNDKTVIRGYKLYWHRSGNGWIEKNKNEISKHPTQYTKICAIKPGAKFKGRIRFENLSRVELGALLSALNLPEGCAHKLGMGKPLGLGSVKIESKVFLSDREGRYKLFQKEWNGLKALGDEDTQKYIKAF